MARRCSQVLQSAPKKIHASYGTLSQVPPVEAPAWTSTRQMLLSLRPQRLPFDRHSAAGFCVPTEVKSSMIPEAGLGSFLQAPVRKGESVRAESIMSVASFEALGGVQQHSTAAVQLQSGADIDALIEFWMTGNKTDFDVADIEKWTSWFIRSVPKSRTDTNRGFSYILSHSFHANHSRPANIETMVEKGMLFHKALRDLDEGEELLLDYTDMQIEQFATKWCAKRKLVDVGTLAVDIERRLSE